MKLIVIRGLPGSGKSAYAETLANNEKAIVVSVDAYFQRDGEYKFKSHEISRAYGYIEGQIDVLMQNYTPTIIADGIHQSEKHVQSYQFLADKYGYSLEIHYPPGEFIWDVSACYKHSIHRVPFRAIKNISDKFEREPLEIAA
jgi:predicted kinase